MNKIKKTFWTKDMTVSNEVEETVLSFEKQLEVLSDENDKLKNKVKKLEEEIYLLKEQNDIYKKIIVQNNISIDIDNNKIKNDGSDNSNHKKISINNIDELKINKDIKENIEHNFDYEDKKTNKNTSFPTPSSSNDKIKKTNCFIRPKKVTIGDCLYLYYKDIFDKQNLKNENNTSTDMPVEQVISNESKCVTKKIRAERDKTLPILQRFKVKIYNEDDIKNSEILQFVGSEDCFMIEYQYKIASKINKKIEDITIDDVINFKIKYEGLRNTYTRRTELRHLITRCKILFEKHGKKLSKFKISLSHLKIMSDEEWEEWLVEFGKLIDEVSKKGTCDHKYKNGKECGKISCKIKHKSTI